MVVKVDGGLRVHEPPFTKAEQAEFYRRIGGGPITVARPASDRRKEPTSPKRQQPPANVRGKGDT
jgi:hypothetical protein